MPRSSSPHAQALTHTHTARTHIATTILIYVFNSFVLLLDRLLAIINSSWFEMANTNEKKKEK